MPPVDVRTLGTLKALVDAGEGPDLRLDREIDTRLRGGRSLGFPWTSTVEAALMLFVELGLTPSHLLAEVCRHHRELEGERFIARLPRGIVSIGLGTLIGRAEL